MAAYERGPTLLHPPAGLQGFQYFSYTGALRASPVAALLPLIETGPGKDSPCAELLSHVKNVPLKNVDVEKADARRDKKEGKPSAVKVTAVPAKK